MAYDIPDDWDNVTLEDIARATYGLVDGPFGSNLKASEYTESGVPVIRGSNLSIDGERFKGTEFVYVSEEKAHELGRSICYANDIIFTKKGTLGQTGLVPDDNRFEKYLLSSNQMKLSVEPNLADALYVYYFVSSAASREKIRRDSEATGVPKTNLAYLRTFPIPLPPLHEQIAISVVLGAFDDKIELNRQMNATLEEMARAIFKSWFVDFDPVRAKARGEKPYGMDAETAALFPDRFEVVNGREMPAGWQVMAVSEAFEINPPRKLTKGEPAPYLAMANAPTTSARALDWRIRKFGSGMRFANGDALFARITPCLENGKSLFVDFLGDKEIGWGSTEFLVFRSKPPLPLEFAYILMRNENFRQFAIANMTGTSGRQRVPKQAFDNYQISIPSAAIAAKYGKLVSKLFDKMKANDDEARTLAELRDTILPRFMSGQFRLPTR